MLSDESEVSAMEKQALIAHCLTYPNAVEDYPFADNDLTIMRHPSGGKWFACIMHLQGKLCINLKCDPVNSVPKGELFAMIAHSFELTAPKIPKAKPMRKTEK